MSGASALRLLARLRLRGALRRQLRRLRTPKGALLTLLGLGPIVAWLGLVFASSLLGERRVVEPELLRTQVSLVALVLTLLSFSTALAHRGLFLPREEIERLFSAPVRRSELVRYRLLTNSVRSLLGGTIVGLIFMRAMPIPALAFVGIVLGMLTLPVLHQLVAILLGRLERRLARRLKRLGSLGLYGLLALGVLVMVLVITDVTLDDLPVVGRAYHVLVESNDGDVLAHPLVALATAPFEPWARMIAATSPSAFLGWFAVCFAICILLAEVTARLPIDFRELSLETAASVAARIRRVRRGGGAAAGRASRRTAGWRVPWLFGRRGAGAVAWRKTAAILRKAKGTLWVSTLVLGLVTFLSKAIGGVHAQAFAGPLLIAGFGTLYLCAGLRFDFRDDLDRMETIKAWPVAQSRLFFAMLLPQVGLVSALLMAAVVLRALLAGTFHPVTVGVVGLLPLVVFAWVALDNAVYLFAPIRFVPGQEGALQNVGRGFLLMLFRMVLLAVAGLVATAAVLAARLVAEILEWPHRAVVAASLAALWLTVLAVDGMLVWVGGKLLRQFDVARDRG